MCGGAAFASAAALPALADGSAPSPYRGHTERLSIVCQHIDAGAEKPISLLHISDTHLTAAYPSEDEWTRKQTVCRSRVFGGLQEEALRDSLAWAKMRVDYVVHTGDLIDFQSEANFDLVRKYFGEAGDSIIGSLGNHEFYHGQKIENEVSKEETRKKVAAAYPFDISFQSTVVNGVNFVALDNSYGTVTAGQATRFEAEVKKGLPIILCMHCPIATKRIARAAKRYGLKTGLKDVPDMSGYERGYRKAGRRTGTQEFHAYLEAQPLLKAILAGHIHMTVADRFSPTAVEYVVGGHFRFHGQEITIS